MTTVINDLPNGLFWSPELDYEAGGNTAIIDASSKPHVILENDERLRRLQPALTSIMRSKEIRSPNLKKALKKLCTMISWSLGVERGGIAILNKARDGAYFSKVFDTATGKFKRHATFPMGKGASQIYAYHNHDLVAVDDVQFPGVLPKPLQEALKAVSAKSTLRAPIISKGEFIGFITAATVTRHQQWQTEQKLFISAIANLVALLIERNEREIAESGARKLADGLRLQQKAMAKLMHNIVQHSGTPSLLYGEVSDALFRHLLVSRVTIRTSMDMDTVPAYRCDAVGKGVHSPPDGAKLGDIGWTPKFFSALRRGPLCIDDCELHPLTRMLYRQRWQQRRIRSVIAAPIVVGDKLQGTVFCSIIGKPRSWSVADRLFINGVANILALSLEQERRENSEQQLRYALHAKGRFLANMSHEIRTPMNGILGVGDLLAKTSLTNRQAELVGTIRQSGNSLLSIINDILDVSRIENGALKVESCTFDPSATVEQVVDLLADQARQKGLRFDLFIDNSTPVAIVADPLRFRQILINLVGNAIKFTERGGISVRIARQTSGEVANNLIVQIKDTGIGIPVPIQETLFQPFAQADTSISRRFGGTGLGLSIARDLAKLMGGDLSLESVQDEGTTVTLRLTIANENTAVAADMHQSMLGNSVQLVIVGERERASVDALEHYAKGVGTSCRHIPDFDVGVDMLRQKQRVAGQTIIGAFAWHHIVGNRLRGEQLASLRASIPNLKLVLLGEDLEPDAGQASGSPIFDCLLKEPLSRSATIVMLSALGADGSTAVERSVVAGAELSSDITCRILFAEDNRINRMIASEFLGRRGCILTFANDGREAVAAFTAGAFDLVMMDCQMPFLDGMSATRQIRDFEIASMRKRTPIIAVTANAFEQDRIECLQSGMDDYISKPYTELQLVDAVLRWQPQSTEPAAITACRSGSAKLQRMS